MKNVILSVNMTSFKIADRVRKLIILTQGEIHVLCRI